MPAGRTIVMIDGGVASHPSLAGTTILQQGFAGPARPTGHGTAVASLLVGRDGAFRGAAGGARLFVADVYGGSPAAGSASAIVRALAWGASKQPDAISISLVGPGNLLLQRAVAILARRGIRMAAAVGNDGPAAPIQYPAAYPGVTAVTAVDARDRALPEAGRAARLDFASPGSDMAAALPGRGYAKVRGTSFATPLVAARLAAAASLRDLDREVARGNGRIGRGILCRSCRTDPKIVRAK
jgi:subtilisin family serine protease